MFCSRFEVSNLWPMEMPGMTTTTMNDSGWVLNTALFSSDYTSVGIEWPRSKQWATSIWGLYHKACFEAITCHLEHPGELMWILHDDVIKWKRFPRYWLFVRRIHRSPVKSPHKGQYRGALMFSLICAWINGWVNHCEAGDLRHHRVHYDVTVMDIKFL